MRKTIRQQLIEKLYREHGIIIDPDSLHSYRRNGYGSRIISWSTIPHRTGINYQSFETMRVCLKLPTRLLAEDYRSDIYTVEIDLDKLTAGAKESATP